MRIPNKFFIFMMRNNGGRQSEFSTTYYILVKTFCVFTNLSITPSLFCQPYPGNPKSSKTPVSRLEVVENHRETNPSLAHRSVHNLNYK